MVRTEKTPKLRLPVVSVSIYGQKSRKNEIIAIYGPPYGHKWTTNMGHEGVDQHPRCVGMVHAKKTPKLMLHVVSVSIYVQKYLKILTFMAIYGHFDQYMGSFFSHQMMAPYE